MISEKYKEEKFDIIVLAGQSNATGSGFGAVKDEYVPDPDIMYLRDVYPVDYRINERGEKFLDCKFPTDYEIAEAEEKESAEGRGKTGNFSLIFAREYKKKFLQPGRKILIVFAPVGGTGFCRKQWGVGNILDNRMNDMTARALALNKENRIVAFLWHQGELDADENRDKNYEQKEEFYFNSVKTMLDNFTGRFNCKNVSVITAGFTDDWKSKNEASCAPVYEAYKRLADSRKNFVFIDTKGLRSNNQKIDFPEDVYHFCREDLYVLGKKYFDEYCLSR
mgnify:FL=1